MDITVLLVFIIVYLGMIIGRIPGLALDRTGIAVLGAIVFVATEHITLDESWEAIDVSTMALLLGLMIVSAQFRLGGFYTKVIKTIAYVNCSPFSLLGILTFVVGLLSAVLCNDIVCFASTPIIIEACSKRRLNPIPYLLALACASNIGSAATIIGNPQNMLIGQTLGLSFHEYLFEGGIPSLFGLVVVWLVIGFVYRKKWIREIDIVDIEMPDFRTWKTIKGFIVLGGVILIFLFTDLPRGVVAIAGGGILLTSRHMASRRMLGEVDWHLLLLFGGLFIVNHVVGKSGILEIIVQGLFDIGIDLSSPVWLFSVTVGLSNLVSNVPAVMLLIPTSNHPMTGQILALSSTLAGNLLLVGSIANMIVVDQADKLNVKIGFIEHAKIGIPVTIITLTIALLWLYAIMG